MARDRYSDEDNQRRPGRDRAYDDTDYRDALDDSAEYDAYDSAYMEAADDGQARRGRSRQWVVTSSSPRMMKSRVRFRS